MARFPDQHDGFPDAALLSLAMMDAGQICTPPAHGIEVARLAQQGVESDELAIHEDRHDDRHEDRGDSSQGWGNHVDVHTDTHLDT